MSLAANLNRGKRGRTWSPNDFHPYAVEELRQRRARERREQPEFGFGMLKAVFIKGGAVRIED